MIHSNTQLRTWATRAQTHMADELALYGIDESDVHLATITPAMVRSILAVVDIAPAAYVTPAPVLEYVAANPPFAPASTPTPVVEPVTPQLRRTYGQPLDDMVADVVAQLRAIAINGEMPTRVQYDVQRGTLPAAATLYTRGLKWPMLAERAGLRTATPLERMVRSQRQAAVALDATTEAFRAEVAAAIRAMSTDGIMPTQKEWDRQRPPRLPINRTVRNRLKLTWSELADQLGLTVNYGSAVTEAKWREARMAQAQPPAEPEAEAAVPAVPFPGAAPAHRNGNGH